MTEEFKPIHMRAAFSPAESAPGAAAVQEKEGVDVQRAFAAIQGGFITTRGAPGAPVRAPTIAHWGANGPQWAAFNGC